MPDPVEEALQGVVDEESFVRFIGALAADFAADRAEAARGSRSHAGPGPRGWENASVDTFLEAAVAWVEDSRRTQPVAANPWRRCADILYAGKLYE